MGTIAPTYKGGLTSMTLHDFIILMTFLIGGTSGYNEIQYKIYKWIHSEVINTSTKKT